MLFAVLFFLIIMSVVVSLRRRDKQTMLLLGLCLSFCCMFVGIIIYLAKTGGLRTGHQFFLFIDLRIQRKLSYMVIPLRKLGYLIAVGRTLFPGFLLMTALNFTMDQKLYRVKKMDYLAMILPVITLILYYPSVFLKIGKISKTGQMALINATIGWIAVYLLLSLVLVIHEYHSVTIPYFRSQFRYMMGFLICITVMYSFYFRQDPIQVYQMYSAEYMRLGGVLYSGTAGGSVSRWLLMSVLTTVFGLFGFLNLRNYSRIEQEEEQGDVMIAKKFDMASKGISVFVHGMKNQLLSNRVLGEKMQDELAQETPDYEKLMRYVTMMTDINNNMIKRMEELYQSIKSNAMILLPVEIHQVTDRALQRFHDKYPDFQPEITIRTESRIIADAAHLSEAFYNLLINGYEAIQEQQGQTPFLKMDVYDERLYVMFRVEDNGKGMSKHVQNKIFDPFYTSKNTNNNWGMGLYYVRQIVKNHFGMLKIESTEHVGTTFFIAIPKYGIQK